MSLPRHEKRTLHWAIELVVAGAPPLQMPGLQVVTVGWLAYGEEGNATANCISHPFAYELTAGI